MITLITDFWRISNVKTNDTRRFFFLGYVFYFFGTWFCLWMRPYFHEKCSISRQKKLPIFIKNIENNMILPQYETLFSRKMLVFTFKKVPFSSQVSWFCFWKGNPFSPKLWLQVRNTINKFLSGDVYISYKKNRLENTFPSQKK